MALAPRISARAGTTTPPSYLHRHFRKSPQPAQPTLVRTSLMQSPPPSSNDSDESSPTRPRGSRLRQDCAEIERLEHANFNKALRISSLEELVLLLQKGEGFTEESVLRELAQLQLALKAREDDLRRQADFWINSVDELTAQLQQAQAAATDVQHESPDTDATLTVSQRNYEEEAKLQEQLAILAKEKQEKAEEIECLRQRNTNLSSNLEEQGRAMSVLKGDHESAMDAIYELESQARQQYKIHEIQTREQVETAVRERDKMWADRCEDLRVKQTSEVLSLQDELKVFKVRCGEAEKELRRADRDIQILRDQKVSCDELHCDFHDLRESNRLLLEEVKYHCSAAEHARKQRTLVELENKDLLDATRLYKDGIADRDADIERYKAMLKKYILKLQQRDSLQQVENNLNEQLKATKALATAASQRLENSSIGGNPLKDCIHRIELASRHWGDFFAQSQKLQQQFDDKLSRDVNRSKKPRWIDDVKQQCSNLRAEATRLSQTMHDLINSLASLLEQGFMDGGSRNPRSRSNVSASARRSLKAVYGNRLAVFTKKLGELEKEIQQPRSCLARPSP